MRAETGHILATCQISPIKLMIFCFFLSAVYLIFCFVLFCFSDLSTHLFSLLFCSGVVRTIYFLFLLLSSCGSHL